MVEKTYCKNYAGIEDCDKALIEELEIAGIEHYIMPVKFKGEVPTRIVGEIKDSGWGFERAWTYWIAKGTGIPPFFAEKLHKEFGTVVRVGGHCRCLSPLEWYKGFGFGYIIICQYELLGGAIHEVILIIINLIVIALAVKFGKYIYDYWDYEVKPFIVGNWNKAKQIAERIV